MTWKVWVLAVALLCIFEGLIPFVAPKLWIESVREVGQMAKPDVVRKIGLILLLIGVVVIWLVCL